MSHLKEDKLVTEYYHLLNGKQANQDYEEEEPIQQISKTSQNATFFLSFQTQEKELHAFVTYYVNKLQFKSSSLNIFP